MEGDLFFNMPGSENSANKLNLLLFGVKKRITVEIASAVFNFF